MNNTISKPLVVLIACLSVGGLISTDIFLPALGDMSVFYKVTEAQIQDAIAIFLLGVAFSQIVGRVEEIPFALAASYPFRVYSSIAEAKGPARFEVINAAGHLVAVSTK
ncbi:hypothetical protein AU509_15445 [Lonsdalea britannica]|uniref:hypothetical protein n=1 Tax=Lonsdalea britannica TaxID=1082704 RepID=UPI000A23F2AD|nr:hypothetical protein [Lonsdalea britannica]OSM94462.1 hypothetical protein AU509_15445 [Lonsdalea britannica]